MRTEFDCTECGQHKTHEDNCTTGYGVDKNGRKVCFDCCAILDADRMKETGKAMLYLTRGADNVWCVSNWPGTLNIPVCEFRKGRHNIAGSRHDVWFTFDQHTWHGVQYGEMTQVCHCKRIAS